MLGDLDHFQSTLVQFLLQFVALHNPSDGQKKNKTLISHCSSFEGTPKLQENL